MELYFMKLRIMCGRCLITELKNSVGVSDPSRMELLKKKKIN